MRALIAEQHIKGHQALLGKIGFVPNAVALNISWGKNLRHLKKKTKQIGK